MPAPKVEEQDEDDDDEEDEEDLLGHQLSASRARWLTGANSAKRAKPAAAAVPVKKKKAKGGAGSRKAKDEPKVFPAAARAVKQEQEECSEEEEGSDGMEYDDFGEVKGFKPGVKGPPKDKRALAVWRNAVARTLLEGEKEKRILESACKTLEAHLTGLAKQTDEELRVAAAAIEEGKRAALALRALGLLEGAALAGTGAVAGRGGGKLNVWDETELPMQESEAESEAEVEMPSEAAIAELRAKVERAQQVEEEARARRLFRPEEQAPLALGWGEGGADVLAPDPRRELSPLERVLSIELLCEEIWGSLSLEAMCALRAASRASYHYHDELAFIQAVGRKCKAWQEEAAKGKKKGGGKQSVSEFGAAVAKMNARERARQAQERQDASDSGSSSSAARRHSKKKRKRPMLSAPSSGSDDSEDEDEDDEVDMSCLVDGGDEGEEEEGKQDLATVMERARTVSYQRQHGLGKGTLEVLRQEGRYVLNSHLATQARENEGSSVRRRVEAFLARCGIRLFPSKYDEGDSNSDSDSDDENGAGDRVYIPHCNLHLTRFFTYQ